LKPHALKFISPFDVVLFERIREIIENLPDVDLGQKKDGEEIVLSCHMLARAIGRIFNLKVADGHAIVGYEHSWLVTSNKNIIDVYPVATIGGPIIIDGNTLYARQIYKQSTTRKVSNGQFGKPWFKNSTRKIERLLRNISASLEQATEVVTP